MSSSATTLPAVALTGTSGCLGRAVCRRHDAAAPGVPLRVLVRQEVQAREFSRDGLTAVRGDITDASALGKLCQGAGAFLHCATFMGKSDPAESQRVNVEGTAVALSAAQRAGVKRFVYVSSISVLAATASPAGELSEGQTPQNTKKLNHYSATKLEGEKTVREFCERHGMDWVIVRPTNVYGPYSRPWNQDVIARIKKFRVVLGTVELDFVHADDVADALWSACLAPAAAGQIFHIGHQMRPLREFFGLTARVQKLWSLPLPTALDRVLSRVVEKGYERFTGRKMSLSLSKAVRYPYVKAQKNLGYAPKIAWDDDPKLFAERQGYRG